MELAERYSFFSYWESGAAFPARILVGSARPAWALNSWIRLSSPVRSTRRWTRRRAAAILDLVPWQFAPAHPPFLRRGILGPPGLVPPDQRVQWRVGPATPRRSPCFRASANSLSGMRAPWRTIAVPICPPSVRTAWQPRLRCTSSMPGLSARGSRCCSKTSAWGCLLPLWALLVYDPSTFPGASEIVFTAGTASSPAKAAIRALTEAAQLGGDFETGSVYEASGLPKFRTPGEADWLHRGPQTDTEGLALPGEPGSAAGTPFPLQRPRHTGNIPCTAWKPPIPNWACLRTSALRPDSCSENGTAMPASGCSWAGSWPKKLPRRTPCAASPPWRQHYPEAHFLSFFHGLLALRTGDPARAADLFSSAEPRQPDPDSAALAGILCRLRPEPARRIGSSANPPGSRPESASRLQGRAPPARRCALSAGTLPGGGRRVPRRPSSGPRFSRGSGQPGRLPPAARSSG